MNTNTYPRLPGLATATVTVVLSLVALALLPGAASAAPGAPCSAPVDVIACENTKPGTPQDVWDVTGDGNQTIQGFATRSSIDHGESIQFKIKSTAPGYRIEIYRIGYYGGNGARLVDTISPSAAQPQAQPACLTDATTGLVDCGNWAVSATWNSPADAVSGVYVARIVRTDTGGESHMLFVVRDDQRRSDVLVKTSDETWAAYNNYGGVSLYAHSSGTSWWSGRGFKVSYNRPLQMREGEPFSSFFNAEYPMVRWMERNGYDVSYIAAIDAARRPAELRAHDLLVSSGHDEYWSQEERANVEAARDAGVNLAFFSGNEVFWKTRWEPSIDSTATADRTLVSYKETYATTRLDPTGIWTGSWRDGRFSPPADGGLPENALTGTLYMVNAYRNDPIEIPARLGKARLWRNTGIDTLAPGETASLPEGMLGYEWDVDADNGHRPAGLIRLSETTRDLPRELLQNQGTVYGAGRATHSLNMYKAPSGALVFGAGTVQWAWGLDGRHDNDGPNQDPRTQQATVNLFADMGVQPRTRQANLTAASPSTDGTPPTVSITGPAAGTRYSRSDVVKITGTAQDTGGGVVGGVEVSVDGGETWHPAKGQEQWEYTWNVTGFGAVDVRARAADDSANIGTADHLALEIGCPCSLWSSAITPGTPAFADNGSYELGVKFRSDVQGYVTGIRFYKGAGNTGTHLGHLWDSLGNRLGEVRFEDETATGWQQASFSKPIAVMPGMTYIASYYAPRGSYSLDRPFFSQPVLAAPLRALGDGVDGPNAVFKSGTSGYPIQSKEASNYWVDVVFDQDGTDRVGPNVLSTRPAESADSAPIASDISAQFDEDLDPASVNGTNLELRRADGTRVTAATRYDAATRSAVIDPATSLDLASSYRVILRGGAGGLRDVAGNVMKADRAWTFTTFSCPCSLWPDTAQPNISSHWDVQAYELGLKFRAEINGYVTGIRFYKGGANTGTHLGHLWTASGTRLGEVRFENETATGWQTAKFSTPIAVIAGTTYIASYFAPNGGYALDRPYFTTGDRARGPLRALADGEEGGNAVFRTGSSGFPTQSKEGSNYWVDLVFDQDGSDRNPPRVLSTTPAAGSTTASLSGDVQVRFDEPVDPTTVTGANLQLSTAGGTSVPASVRYDAATQTATLDPLALLGVGAGYRAVVRGGAGGVRDLAGNALGADYAWTFSTFTCPCSIWPDSTVPATAAYPDSVSYELGMKFRSELDGYVTGIRFYKGAGNTGTHLGHLWTAGGTQLGEVTFANETATGWQTASFATPIAISAATTYIASYYAPRGNYAMNRPYFTTARSSGPLKALADGEDGGNALFKSGTSGFPIKSKEASNYWVDLTFTPAG